MSSQYSFAPYQDPPEDIPAREREQAACNSASHYSSESAPATVQGDAFLGGSGSGDDRINQYETSLPLRYTSHRHSTSLTTGWISKQLLHMRFPLSLASCC